MGGTRRSTTVEQLVEQFGRWLPGEPDPEDLGNLHLFLTVRRDVCGAELVHWRRGDVRELLLDVFPRKVAPDESLVRDGPRVLGQFFEFLAQGAGLRGAPLPALRAELAEVAPQFRRAMAGGSRSGTATSLVSAMIADGVAPDDPAAVEEWIAQFNSRPFEERAALTDGALPTEPAVVLPAVVLAPEDELRLAAASAPLVQRVRTLLAHVGPKGLAATSTGALRLVDAKALAAACGDEERLHRPARWQGEVRRMADLPGVEEAYELAHLAGLVQTTATRVRRDDDAPGAADDLALVAGLADAALETGVLVGDAHPSVEDLVDAVGDELVGVLAAVYAAGEPVDVDELAAGVAEEIGLRPDSPPTSYVRAYLERVLERFERLGVLRRLGVQVPPEHAFLGSLGERTTSVALTPLGVWWLQRALTEFGLRAPVRGALAGATAAELCDGVGELAADDGEQEVRAWLAAREPRGAADELARLLADPEGTRRHFALHVLDGLPDAADSVRPLLDDAAARPYARMWLESRGAPVAEHYRQPEDELLLFVDTAAVLIDLGAVDEIVHQLSALGQTARKVELVRQLWRAQSSSTEPVLTALAGAAPPPVSKAARKALHSLRSARR